MIKKHSYNKYGIYAHNTTVNFCYLFMHSCLSKGQLKQFFAKMLVECIGLTGLYRSKKLHIHWNSASLKSPQ